MDRVTLTLKSSEVNKSWDAWGGEGAWGIVSLLIEQEQRDSVLSLGQVVGQVIIREQFPLEAGPVAEVQVSEDGVKGVSPLSEEAILDQWPVQLWGGGGESQGEQRGHQTRPGHADSHLEHETDIKIVTLWHHQLRDTVHITIFRPNGIIKTDNFLLLKSCSESI